jgi:hypothetical protein
LLARILLIVKITKMMNCDWKVLEIQFITGEVFVVIVVSRMEWHIDARRFLTTIKELCEINLWLMND